MLIRPAIQEDVNSIAELEKSVSSPWSETQIAAEMAYPAAIIFVASRVKDGAITGWCSLRLVAPEAELLKIAIHPNFRRSRLGEQLLNEAMKHVATAGCKILFLEVRAKNHPARNFYLKLGFKEHGVRKNYYNQPGDDAILYRRNVVSY